MHKTDEFLELYQQFFSKYDKARLLEIGVQFGGSIKYWKEKYKFDVWGLDIKDEYKDKQVIKGDQTDTELLKSLGSFDIVIDDGGHTMNQQQISFDVLWASLNKGGLYVIEDLHTSYWREFQDKELTTVNALKGLVDKVNWEATANDRNRGFIERIAKSDIASIHFYPSIVFICKN